MSIGCVAKPLPAPAEHESRADAPSLESCAATGEVTARERCFAGLPQTVLDDCERLRPGACRPYADMPRLEKQLSAAEQSLVEDSAPGADPNDPVHEAGIAWRRFRDAECVAHAHLDGMTPSASPEVVQACRVTMTKERLEVTRRLLANRQGSQP